MASEPEFHEPLPLSTNKIHVGRQPLSNYDRWLIHLNSLLSQVMHRLISKDWFEESNISLFWGTTFVKVGGCLTQHRHIVPQFLHRCTVPQFLYGRRVPQFLHRCGCVRIIKKINCLSADIYCNDQSIDGPYYILSKKCTCIIIVSELMNTSPLQTAKTCWSVF